MAIVDMGGVEANRQKASGSIVFFRRTACFFAILHCIGARFVL